MWAVEMVEMMVSIRVDSMAVLMAAVTAARKAAWSAAMKVGKRDASTAEQ